MAASGLDGLTQESLQATADALRSEKAGLQVRLLDAKEKGNAGAQERYERRIGEVEVQLGLYGKALKTAPAEPDE